MNMVPEGTWRARGVTAALGYTSQDGEQAGVEIVFSPDQGEDVDGRHMTWYGSFSEKAEVHTLKALRAFGWSNDDLSNLEGIDTNEVEAVVAHEQDLQGEWRARVRFINPVGSGGVAMKTKMSEDQARAFAERMRGRVLALGKASPAGAPKPTSGGAPPAATSGKPKAAAKPKAGAKAGAEAAAVDNDDVPF